MNVNKTKQMFCGAAVAALLIVPSFARAASPAPPVPHAPAPPPMPQPVLAPAEPASVRDWVSEPQKSFAVRAVKIGDLAGTLIVAVRPDGPMTLDIAGMKSRVDGLNVSADGGTLSIEGQRTSSVWDWHDWFNFSDHGKSDPKALVVKLTVPKGADVRVDDLIGDAAIGDTMGPLHFGAAASTAKIGRVGEAKISVAGSGKIDVVEVDGPLDLAIAGSGKVHVGQSRGVKTAIAGAGDAQFGAIAGGLHIDIAGSGDVAADSVNGPVKISIAGSGSVKIAKGEAKPLKVSIMGSGNIDFGGTAVDPSISALGSGRVRLKAYSGHLSSSGSVNVQVNGQSVRVNGGDDDGDDDNDDD